MILKIGKKKFNLKDRAFVIAEIGHNHQGEISKAKELFVKAKESGASAVKLQKKS